MIIGYKAVATAEHCNTLAEAQASAERLRKALKKDTAATAVVIEYDDGSVTSMRWPLSGRS